MNSNSDIWRQYYEKALSRKHSPATEYAISHNGSGLNVAVDCGCGTGSDVSYLAQQGYRVHGFDLNEDAVAICRDRFADDPLIDISQSSFERFDYPPSGLTIANSSLFFADPARFLGAWRAIAGSLVAGGVFVGDFMGPEDSWATGYRSPTTPLTDQRVLALFAGFEILRFRERNELARTAIGRMKQWHTFSVVAVKL